MENWALKIRLRIGCCSTGKTECSIPPHFPPRSVAPSSHLTTNLKPLLPFHRGDLLGIDLYNMCMLRSLPNIFDKLLHRIVHVRLRLTLNLCKSAWLMSVKSSLVLSDGVFSNLKLYRKFTFVVTLYSAQRWLTSPKSLTTNNQINRAVHD